MVGWGTQSVGGSAGTVRQGPYPAGGQMALVTTYGTSTLRQVLCDLG